MFLASVAIRCPSLSQLLGIARPCEGPSYDAAQVCRELCRKNVASSHTVMERALFPRLVSHFAQCLCCKKPGLCNTTHIFRIETMFARRMKTYKSFGFKVKSETEPALPVS